MVNAADRQNCRIILRKTSLIDYPGLVSAVFFFPGCNLRCPWCHNRELVLGNDTNADYISLEEALAHIKKRRNVLGGVVLSGGEPTLYNSLGSLISQIKSLGLKVKLDTNGLLPDALKLLLAKEDSKPDYIAMDLKTSPERYSELLPDIKTVKGQGVDNPGEAIKKSIVLIRDSLIPHEFRSLDLPLPPDNGQGKNPSPAPYFGDQEKAIIAALVGDSPWNIRPFVPGNCIDPTWNAL